MDHLYEFRMNFKNNEEGMLDFARSLVELCRNNGIEGVLSKANHETKTWDLLLSSRVGDRPLSPVLAMLRKRYLNAE